STRPGSSHWRDPDGRFGHAGPNRITGCDVYLGVGGVMAESPDVVMQRLHDEHAGALWGHRLRLTNHDRARAEDVCQETLLRAWRNASLLDESQGSVRAWLFTVARNIVIDESRPRGSRSQNPLGILPAPPSHAATH